MATLTSDITADQTVIGVTGSSRTTGHYRFRIDDELMDLQGFPKYELRGGYRQHGVDHSRWIVTRGVGGSTAATHSAGDTLKGVTSALVSSESETPPAPWAGAGTEQTVRLLGPFSVAWNTPDIAANQLVSLTTLSAGTIILRAWMIERVRWNTATVGKIAVAENEFGDNSADLWAGNIDSNEPWAVDDPTWRELTDILVAVVPTLFVGGVTTAGNLVFYVDVITATAGSGDIYALIAEPA